MIQTAQSVDEFLAAATDAFEAFPSNAENGTKKMGDTHDRLLINDNDDTGHLISRSCINASFQLHYSPNGDITFCSMRPEHLDFIVRADKRLQGACMIPAFVPKIIRRAISDFAPLPTRTQDETKRLFEQMFGEDWSEHAPENYPQPFSVLA